MPTPDRRASPHFVSPTTSSAPHPFCAVYPPKNSSENGYFNNISSPPLFRGARPTLRFIPSRSSYPDQYQDTVDARSNNFKTSFRWSRKYTHCWAINITTIDDHDHDCKLYPKQVDSPTPPFHAKQSAPPNSYRNLHRTSLCRSRTCSSHSFLCLKTRRTFICDSKFSDYYIVGGDVFGI